MPTPAPHQESPPATLPAPYPTRPVAGRPVDADAPVFDWTPVPGAARYRVQIGTSATFDTIHYDETTGRGAALPLGPVLPDGATTVYWRVQAEGGDDAVSAWSEPARFAVATADREGKEGALRVDAPPVPLQPDSRQDTPVDPSAVPFSWEGIPEASGYQLQVAPTKNFSDPSIDLTVDQTTSLTLYDLLPPEVTSFYWRVRPLFPVAGPGPWSDPVPFMVAPLPEDEEDLASEAADPQASARAAGPVAQARTSGAVSLTVSLLAVLSFIAIIFLIILFS